MTKARHVINQKPIPVPSLCWVFSRLGRAKKVQPAIDTMDKVENTIAETESEAAVARTTDKATATTLRTAPASIVK